MSFDLGIWYSPRALSDEEAREVYDALAEGTEPPAGAPVAASPAVAAFLAALGAAYPDLDGVPDDQIAASPWASGFETSDRHALLNIRWKAPDDVLDVIMALAAKYVLVLAADGYRVVFSLAELAPDLSGRRVLLADRRDGQPLDAHEGPLRLIVPDDRRPTRWVHHVTALVVRRAAP